MDKVLEKFISLSNDDEKKEFAHKHPQIYSKKTQKSLRRLIKEKESRVRKLEKQLADVRKAKDQTSIGLDVLKDGTLKAKMDWLKKNHLEIYQDVFGKQYDNVGMYEDYRENLMIAASMLLMEKFGNENLIGLDRVKIWRGYGYPNFFISRGITEAIERTDLSSEQAINPTTISLPYEAFAVVFPKEKSPFRLIHVERDEEGLHLYGRFRDEDLKDTDVFVALDELKIGGIQYPHNLIADWFFKILYAMHSRPEIIQTGKKLGTQKKSNITWYEPIVIGAKYQYKSAGNSPNVIHSTKRMHWRRGHFRQQHFGVKFSEVKTIWIEPMLVNSTKFESTQNLI